MATRGVTEYMEETYVEEDVAKLEKQRDDLQARSDRAAKKADTLAAMIAIVTTAGMSFKT